MLHVPDKHTYPLTWHSQPHTHTHTPKRPHSHTHTETQKFSYSRLMSNKAQPPAKSNCLWYHDTRTHKKRSLHSLSFPFSYFNRRRKKFSPHTHAPGPPPHSPHTLSQTPEPVARTYAIIMSVYKHTNKLPRKLPTEIPKKKYYSTKYIQIYAYPPVVLSVVPSSFDFRTLCATLIWFERSLLD